jgi:UPF0755 protein
MRRLLVVLLAAVLIAAGGAGLWFWSYLTSAPEGRDEVVVVIPRGTGVRGIGAILSARGVLEDDIRYLAYVHFAGLTTRLKAGEYSIPAGLTPPEVLRLLATGATLRHQVTVPEGLRLEQVAGSSPWPETPASSPAWASQWSTSRAISFPRPTPCFATKPMPPRYCA